MFKVLFWFTFAVALVLYRDDLKAKLDKEDFGIYSSLLFGFVLVLCGIIGIAGSAKLEKASSAPVASDQFREAAKLIAPPVDPAPVE